MDLHTSTLFAHPEPARATKHTPAAPPATIAPTEWIGVDRETTSPSPPPSTRPAVVAAKELSTQFEHERLQAYAQLVACIAHGLQEVDPGDVLAICDAAGCDVAGLQSDIDLFQEWERLQSLASPARIDAEREQLAAAEKVFDKATTKRDQLDEQLKAAQFAASEAGGWLVVVADRCDRIVREASEASRALGDSRFSLFTHFSPGDETGENLPVSLADSETSD